MYRKSGDEDAAWRWMVATAAAAKKAVARASRRPLLLELLRAIEKTMELFCARVGLLLPLRGKGSSKQGVMSRVSAICRWTTWGGECDVETAECSVDR